MHIYSSLEVYKYMYCNFSHDRLSTIRDELGRQKEIVILKGTVVSNIVYVKIWWKEKLSYDWISDCE